MWTPPSRIQRALHRLWYVNNQSNHQSEETKQKLSCLVSNKTSGGLKKVAKASIPFVSTISVKEVAPLKTVKPAKPIMPPKPVASKKPFSVTKPTAAVPPKSVNPVVVYPKIEIKKSDVSLSDDYAANPHDYETQDFDFNLKCVRGHFFGEGKQLPLSKGKPFCPKCGERLRKPKRKQYIRNERTFA